MAKKRRPEALFIRVLVSKRDGQWLAEGLEHHLMTQAPSWRQAVDSFVRILTKRLQLDHQYGREPLANLSQAPDSVFDAWTRMEQLQNQIVTERVFAPTAAIPEAYVINQIAESGASDINA